MYAKCYRGAGDTSVKVSPPSPLVRDGSHLRNICTQGASSLIPEWSTYSVSLTTSTYSTVSCHLTVTMGVSKGQYGLRVLPRMSAFKNGGGNSVLTIHISWCHQMDYHYLFGYRFME
jgi:hypothetical protein